MRVGKVYKTNPDEAAPVVPPFAATCWPVAFGSVANIFLPALRWLGLGAGAIGAGAGAEPAGPFTPSILHFNPSLP